MTILDSLDTLWLMGLRQEFEEATSWVRSDKLNFAKVGAVSVFETTIRALGGLLGAHALSGEPIFVERARELGERLLPAFNSRTGLAKPWLELNTSRVPPKKERTSIAEAGTLQLEFGRLSQVTGDPRFDAAARKAHEFFHRASQTPHPGVRRGQKGTGAVFPVMVHTDTGAFTGRPSFGASGDSYYEYLLKCWVFAGRPKQSPLLEMYAGSVQELRRSLVKTSKGNRVYVGDADRQMQHLACFLPGLLALGAHMRPEAPERWDDFRLAEDLARTCYEMYSTMATGLAPESVVFQKSQKPDAPDFEPGKGMQWNLLRPEAVETFFILHELTGDAKYREWGHKVFEAFEKHSKTTYGYGAHPDVNSGKRCCEKNDDKQPTFWLAETLKYLYLLQDPDHTISLDRYVLNTEAHPLPLPG